MVRHETEGGELPAEHARRPRRDGSRNAGAVLVVMDDRKLSDTARRRRGTKGRPPAGGVCADAPWTQRRTRRARRSAHQRRHPPPNVQRLQVRYLTPPSAAGMKPVVRAEPVPCPPRRSDELTARLSGSCRRVRSRFPARGAAHARRLARSVAGGRPRPHRRRPPHAPAAAPAARRHRDLRRHRHPVRRVRRAARLLRRDARRRAHVRPRRRRRRRLASAGRQARRPDRHRRRARHALGREHLDRPRDPAVDRRLRPRAHRPTRSRSSGSSPSPTS